MRRLAVSRPALACAVLACALLGTSATAGARPGAASWAAPQIERVVAAGLMAPSVESFRPDDPLTAGELAVVLASLGVAEVSEAAPERLVSLRELDARLVTAAGLRQEARALRLAALEAGLAPTQWLGTETVARLLGLRVNHPREREQLELQPAQPATRAEAAFSVARLLALRAEEVEAVRAALSTFAFPELTPARRELLRRALRLVGSPYVWAGTSERPQQLFGRTLPGGFDCSGLVWRVFKLEPLAGAPTLPAALRGRTSYDMSAEVPASARLGRDLLQPADVVFFGARGPRSRPSEVGHMGIYVGNGWMVHSSRAGTTLQPLIGWYETTFAWGRDVLREAGVEAGPPPGRRGPETTAAGGKPTTT
ncbi:MAG TPA: NlpC/P60 family protein [Gaiellaceae bacterium]|nr:NlpC/P60 family protein [Gaiellaceae bacterium]